MTSATTPKVVFLTGDCEHYIQSEAPAAAAITPGMLVERTSASKIQVHGTAGAVANLSFADYDKMAGGSIGTAYAADDTVMFRTVMPGTEVYALVPAAEPAVAIAAKLTSNGDGTLTAAVDGDIVIAEAAEAVDNSAGGAVARIKVYTIAPQTLNPGTN